MEPEEKEKRKYKSRTRGDEKGGYLGGFLAIIVIVGIFLGIKYFSVPENNVKGVATDSETKQLEEEKQTAKENVKGDIQSRLEKIKADIDNLNAVDVTTQSPQVKKIIDDLQSLQKLPKDQAKNFCQQICTNFE